MKKFTFAVSKTLKKRMDKYPDVDWRAVALNGIAQEVKLLNGAATTDQLFRKARTKVNATKLLKEYDAIEARAKKRKVHGNGAAMIRVYWDSI